MNLKLGSTGSDEPDVQVTKPTVAAGGAVPHRLNGGDENCYVNDVLEQLVCLINRQTLQTRDMILVGDCVNKCINVQGCCYNGAGTESVERYTRRVVVVVAIEPLHHSANSYYIVVVQVDLSLGVLLERR